MSQLSKAQDPQARGFIGQPPEQVAEEVNAVQQSAVAVLQAIDAWTDTDCSFKTTEACDREFVRISNTGADFAVSVQAWD
jgi:hypothetical protein